MLLWFYFLGGSGDEAEPLLQRRDPPVGRSSQARGTVMTIKHHWSGICLVIYRILVSGLIKIQALMIFIASRVN